MIDGSHRTPRVLDGVRVVDFGRVLAGPHCAYLLCVMGAEVIKVERPFVGDDSRADPFIYEPELSGCFMQTNWGKRSISIDLQHPEAKSIICDLVSQSDVVVENFRPGVMARLGFGYEELAKVNPRIIMCSVSAYGQTGPYSQRVGYGPIAEAVAAIPEVTGERDGPPMPTQYAIADNLAAALGATSICAALYWRDRSGQGQHIDMSLLDAAFQGQDQAFETYLGSEGRMKMTRRGLRDVTYVPWGFFKGNDGWVLIMCGNESMWAPLARAMDREDLVKDPLFDNFQHRYENRDTVYRLLEEWVLTFKSVDEVVSRLSEVGIPCDRVNDVAQALEHPQVKARDLIIERDHPTLGKMRIVNSGLRFSHTASDPTGYPPSLGEHNREILVDLLGRTHAEVDRLTEDGVLYEEPRVRAREQAGRQNPP